MVDAEREYNRSMRRVLVLIPVVLVLSLASASAQIDCAGPLQSDRPLLNTAKTIFVGTLVEDKIDSPTRRFQVTEAFKGVNGNVVDLNKGADRFDFHLGKVYLVFAVPCGWQGGKCLTNLMCFGTRTLEDAAAVLEQLRAEKTGKRVSAVYGILARTLGEERDDWKVDYRRPLPNILITLQSDKKAFRTRTDQQGAYAFNGVL